MLNLLNKIAAAGNEPLPNPEKKIGRKCYAFSEAEDKAFDLIVDNVREMFDKEKINPDDYAITRDAAGNLFITYFGEDPAKTVMSGSHADSVLNGGMYDGPAGVNSAFNFLETIIKEERKPRFNYTIAVFRGEESSPKTGVTCLGSRIATGTISKEELEKIRYKKDDGTNLPLKDFLNEKYGPDSWNRILNEIENPHINAKNTLLYEELHIEQSRVCDLHEADAGIVCDGIGSAIRETVKIPAPAMPPEQTEITPSNNHVQINIQFTGAQSHTGGTPPNPRLKQQHSPKYYRRDALVAAALFTRLLQKAASLAGYKNDIKITKFAPAKETGFTTVPTEQQVEIMIPANKFTLLKPLMVKVLMRVCADYDVTGDLLEKLATPGTFTAVPQESLKNLKVPASVERLIREEVNNEIENGESTVGKVRGTVTDFTLDPNTGTRFNLDLRDVDTQKMTPIREQIHSRLNGAAIAVLDEKPYTPVNPQSVQIKEQLAQELGLKTVSMPSLPGHDAASLGKIGVPIAMTYVAHDGISHSPAEKITPENYAKAERLSHAYLKTLLF